MTSTRGLWFSKINPTTPRGAGAGIGWRTKRLQSSCGDDVHGRLVTLVMDRAAVSAFVSRIRDPYLAAPP